MAVPTPALVEEIVSVRAAAEFSGREIVRSAPIENVKAPIFNKLPELSMRSVEFVWKAPPVVLIFPGTVIEAVPMPDDMTSGALSVKV